MKVIKVSDHVYDKLKQMAETRGLSINNMIEAIINVYQGGLSEEKPIKQVIDKFIVLHYNTRCYRCGRELKAGEQARYNKYVYDDGTAKSVVLCLDCFYQSDALANYYLQKKKLEVIVKGLKRKADEYAEKIAKAETTFKLSDIKLQLQNIMREFSNDRIKLMLGEDYAKVVKLVEDTNIKVEELLNKIKDIELYLKLRETPKRKEAVAHDYEIGR